MLFTFSKNKIIGIKIQNKNTFCIKNDITPKTDMKL